MTLFQTGTARRRSTAAIAGAVVLQLALLTTAALTTNPDYNFPGVIELLLIGVSLCCLALAVRPGTVWDRDDARAAVVMTGLLLLLCLRYVVGRWLGPGSAATSCGDLPGTVAQVECQLQLPFGQAHGLRQLLLHATALAVFWGAAGLARSAGPRTARLAPVFLIAPFVFAVAAFSPRLFPGRETLAGWNFVLNAITSTSRGAGLTSNPGWLWPLLAAPGALAAGLVASHHWPRAAAGGGVLAVTLMAIVDAGQRGGYLLVGLLVTSAVVFVVLWGLRRVASSPRRRAMTWAGVSGVALAAALAGAASLGRALEWLNQAPVLKGARSKSLALADQARETMWACGLGQIPDAWWNGHGYGSWLREAKAACPDTPYIYDTAHNLWLQMAVELGLPHALLITAAIAWLLYRGAVVRSLRPIEIEAAVFVAVPAFLLTTGVQEIDYIPATYYMFAAVGGLLWGASRHPEQAPVDWTHAAEGAPRRTRAGRLLVAAGLLAVLGSAAYAHTISWGGYTYVPTTSRVALFLRWFRPEGAVAAPAFATGHAYAVFGLAEPPPAPLAIRTSGTRAAAVTPTGVTLAAGRTWPRQYRYQAGSWFKNLSRLNAFALELPPLPADLLLVAEHHTSAWERAADGTAEKWCRNDCVVDLTTPEPPTADQQLWVYVDQPCTTPDQPARVTYVVEAMTRGRYVRAATGELRLTRAGVPEPIPLPAGSTPPDLWRVAIRAADVCRATIPDRGRSSLADFRGVRIRFAAPRR